MARNNGKYSTKAGLDRDDLTKLNLSELAEGADVLIRYTRMTVKNLMKDVGATKSIRDLISNRYFDLKINKSGQEVLTASLSDKTRGQLIEMIKTMQGFGHSKSKTKTGLHEGAERQREGLASKGYTFQDQATDVDLDWIYSMLRDVLNAFGDPKSPPNIVEAVFELIMDNQDMTYEEIKQEAIRKIQEGEYIIDYNNDLIWR